MLKILDMQATEGERAGVRNVFPHNQQFTILPQTSDLTQPSTQRRDGLGQILSSRYFSNELNVATLLNVKFENNYHEPFSIDYKELMLLWLECLRLSINFL